MRTIMIDGDEKVACPRCNHGFPLSEGLSRQSIERHAEDFERALAEKKKALERELVAEKDRALAKLRGDEQRKFEDERRRIEAQHKAQIESAQREVADLKRKLEQGSQQLQGEALEVSLEALLRTAFPLDEIVPVPKGMNGADLLQHVRNPAGHCCGTIIWEAKQTKAWQPAWLRKLKDDQRAIGAELAVLVTAAMPGDRSGRCGEPFVREADVWIARFDAARPLADALRAMLLELHKARQANLGRAEKMELVYSYICSPQFAQRVKSVAEGFVLMRQELEAEKMAAARMFKKREMQLTRMQEGLIGVVGDLQGIGEQSLAQLDAVAPLPLALEEELES
jgi:hypothetical protein